MVLVATPTHLIKATGTESCRTKGHGYVSFDCFGGGHAGSVRQRRYVRIPSCMHLTKWNEWLNADVRDGSKVFLAPSVLHNTTNSAVTLLHAGYANDEAIVSHRMQNLEKETGVPIYSFDASIEACGLIMRLDSAVIAVVSKNPKSVAPFCTTRSATDNQAWYMTRPTFELWQQFSSQVKSLVANGTISGIIEVMVGDQRAVRNSLLKLDHEETNLNHNFVVTTHAPRRGDIVPGFSEIRPKTARQHVLRFCDIPFLSSIDEMVKVFNSQFEYYEKNAMSSDPLLTVVWECAHLFPMKLCTEMLTSIAAFATKRPGRVSLKVIADASDVGGNGMCDNGVCPWRLAILDSDIMNKPMPTSDTMPVSKCVGHQYIAAPHEQTSKHVLLYEMRIAGVGIDTLSQSSDQRTLLKECLVFCEIEDCTAYTHVTSSIACQALKNQLPELHDALLDQLQAVPKEHLHNYMIYNTGPPRVPITKQSRKRKKRNHYALNDATVDEKTLNMYTVSVDCASAVPAGLAGHRCILITERWLRWHAVYAILARMQLNDSDAKLCIVGTRDSIASFKANCKRDFDGIVQHVRILNQK